MSLQMQDLFEFGEFRLDVAEKVLLREGVAISVTPKVFETLQVLIENAGRLVEKGELMERIWPDHFVEESNLSFNIKMLRRALGDDAAKPRFIETVPRRGYRFVAEVRQGIRGEAIPNGQAVIPQPAAERRARSRFADPLLIALAILCVGGISAGMWYARGGMASTGPQILSAAFSSENLSTNGAVLHAVISPDGKNIAYTNGIGGDKQSVWLRQLDSSNNVQIIPPSDEFYFNLAFSPDGNFLYFVRGSRPGGPAEQNSIYRISIFGGIATKLVDGVEGGISVSRDGEVISFVRCRQQEEEWCSLWIADSSDGGDQRKLVSRPAPFRIGDNEISPDGRTIAFGSGQSRNGANDYSLAVVDIATGVVSEVTKERFFEVKRLVWMPDQRTLLITALKYPDQHIRIWQVSAETGEAVVLTKDSEDYAGLSLTADASRLVTTQPRPDFYLDLYPAGDHRKVRRLAADAATVTFAPDGRLIVSYGRQGNFELWSVDAAGGGERPLTNTLMDDLAAVVSGDGAAIFFSSNRTGESQVWRMRSDGSDQRQVTTAEGGRPLAVDPAGMWVYYHSALRRTLRRVSLADAREEIVLNLPKPAYAVSPDASLAAFSAADGGRTRLSVVSLPGGEPVANFELGGGLTKLAAMAWSRDSKNLFYIAAADAYKNNTLWMQPLGKQAPKKIAELPSEGVRNENSLAVSPDNKSFAVIQGIWKRDAVLLKGLK